ncbi:excitatory amino acid transporter 5 isoform X1 [Entelurus aequoreus]|uniref:excitatory amino acid transporter 5 isoform X1 n=1 Tax=Entelurus aequoreus TaxID=161455 RepID=UPI002B1DA3AE|nr:excitatory amino acid transporter 5 isoform X1 [Entelurus aequoreus]
MMHILLAKLLGLLALLALMLAGVLVPARLLAADRRKAQSYRRAVSLCNAFSGGVFLATCFNALLPAVRAKVRPAPDLVPLPAMDELLLGGGGGEDEARSEHSSCAAGDAGGSRAGRLFAKVSGGIRRNLRDFAKRNGLLILSVVAVLSGCTLGFMLRGTHLSTQAKIYFSFPGELLMRMLKMLILPLITSSLMSGLSSMESKACCRMGVLTVTYYLWTTFIAVVVGIVLVIIIKPGVGTEMESNRLGGGPVMTSADALLDLIRNMVPSNLIEATFQQYKTDLVPILKVPTRTIQPNFVYVVPDEREPKGRTVFLELTPPPEVTYKTSPGSSQQMNVLGIVIFSATMGLLLGRMGERGAPLVNVCQCINECVMKIINAAVWYFPFGIIFLVAGKILDMQDPSTLGKKLGWYGVTVLAGLFVHGLVLLPLFYFVLTRKNPFTYIRGLLQALVIALATSSSSATLPITMKCLLENCHVDRQIARFVLPVGATINMDGTALYEAVAAIFIAQVNDYELDFGQLVTISITATAASIGAAGIPQAGLVTMVIVLTSVGLPPDDITLIVAIDWILDRFRTMINVLGDALAAGIIAHLCRKDFPLSGTGKGVPSYGTHTPHNHSVNVPMTELHTHKDGDVVLDGHAHTVYYNICQV